MKNIPANQQFRRATGEFINKQDQSHINKAQQDEWIKQLAKYPGRHQGNASRQDLANAMLNFVTFVSTLRPAPAQPTAWAIPSNATASPSSAKEHIASITSDSVLQRLPDRLPIPVLLGENNSQPAQNKIMPTAPRHRRETNRELKTSDVIPMNQRVVRELNSTALTENSSFSLEEKADILHEARNQVIDSFLQDNEPDPHAIVSSFGRVNRLVVYIDKNREEHIDKVARQLLSASASYGEKPDETIADSLKHAVLIEYLNREILGMSLDTWCFIQAQDIKSNDHQLFNHANLKNRLTRILNDNIETESLSSSARLFYQDEVLKKVLPTFVLDLDTKEDEELKRFNINDPQWGFIYAGAMLLASSGAEFITLTLKEHEETGMMLDSLLRKGTVPQEYINFFRLPALFYYASQHKTSPDESIHDPEKLAQIYQHYFDYTDAWVKENNPALKLPIMVKNWKSRSELAREVLVINDLPEVWVTAYLDSHKEFVLPRGEGKGWIKLPNIDQRFARQNEDIALVASQADKILLPQPFEILSEADRNFITHAKIQRVIAMFDARQEIRDVPLHRSSKKGLEMSGALTYPIPDKIDLLRCTNNEEERIYALGTLHSGEYYLYRVDRRRDAMLSLLDDSFVPYSDPEYQLRIMPHLLLKESTDPVSIFINVLARLHGDKLRDGLKAKGYEKTAAEKVGRYILKLLPFYTCITESIKGNSMEAIPACLGDILSLLPVAGLAMKTGIHFGTALSRSAAGAIAYGIQETTIQAALRQMSRQMLSQFPSIAKEISPDVIKNLGIGFLRGIDPGIESLSRAGVEGVHSLTSIIKATTKSKRLNLLSSSLEKLNFPATKMTYQITIRYHPQTQKMLEVADIGTVNGKKTWVQVNRNTGELYDQKFLLNAENNLVPVESPLTKQLALVQKMDSGIRSMNPREATPSGSCVTGAVPKRHAVASGSTYFKRRKKTQSYILPDYNQLPPVCGNDQYWNKVRQITNAPYPSAPPGMSNTRIQPLQQFIPVPPILLYNRDYINHMLTEFTNNALFPYRWRAYAGFGKNVPPHISWLQTKIRANIRKSKRTLKKADEIMSSIDYNNIMNHQVGKFFAGMLNTQRVDIIVESARRLSTIIAQSYNLVQAAEDVDFSNFVIISTDLIKSPTDPNLYISTVSDEIIETVPFAATSIPDAEGRILIYADAYLSKKAMDEGDFLSASSNTQLTMAEVLVHEYAHSSSNSFDIFKLYLTKKRQKVNAVGISSSFITQFYDIPKNKDVPRIFTNDDFILFILYLKLQQGISIPLSYADVFQAVLDDRMLCANMILSDADAASRVITSLVEKRPFNTKYKVKREASKPLLQNESTIDEDDATNDTHNFLPIILSQIVRLHLNILDQFDDPTTEDSSPQITDNIKINGVTMDIQVYGDSESKDMLFPEINEIDLRNIPLNINDYKKALSSLLPKQRKALKTWTTPGIQHILSYDDDTPGIIGGINTPANKKLLKGLPLLRKEKTIHNNIMNAIASKKIPQAEGNYIRESCYINGTWNPWLEDEIEVDDYLTTFPSFMSVSSDISTLLTPITDASNIDNHIDSVVFYKIENASHAVPLLPFAPKDSPLTSNLIYPPGTLFKVKSIAIATPSTSEALYANKEMYLPNRVAIVLTEVGEEEAKEVITAQNIFSGKTITLK